MRTLGDITFESPAKGSAGTSVGSFNAQVFSGPLHIIIKHGLVQ